VLALVGAGAQGQAEAAEEAEQEAGQTIEEGMMANYVACSRCGKAVSREVDGNLVVRAFVECPECVEKQGTGMGVELKSILMELGNRLVMQEGWEPAYSHLRSDVAKTVLREDLPGRPSTDLIAAFTYFLNKSEEARKHLKDLGVKWEM
jgi:hypothetical protein